MLEHVCEIVEGLRHDSTEHALENKTQMEISRKEGEQTEPDPQMHCTVRGMQGLLGGRALTGDSCG